LEQQAFHGVERVVRAFDVRNQHDFEVEQFFLALLDGGAFIPENELRNGKAGDFIRC
jgi:hypothetical protein